METISFQVKEKSKIPFIVELLSQFDYVQINNYEELLQLIEDIALANAIKENDKETVSRDEIFDFLNSETKRNENGI